MNVLMVTPHLPPHQAANALLPHLLGQGLAQRGHSVQYLTFGPPAGASWATAPAHRARFVQRSRQHLWNIQARLGRPEGSVENARQLVADMDALLGPGNSSSQRMRADLARHFVELGDYGQAVHVYDELEAGLPPEAARTLALQTVLGAARMLTESDIAPDELRRRVTSPNGTTHAAIETFEAGGFRTLVAAAIHAARVRGAELSANNP